MGMGRQGIHMKPIDSIDAQGDPIQRLLTCLGRFQCQLARAEEGAPTTDWGPEAAVLLNAGREIAEAENWHSITLMLTEVQRIMDVSESADKLDLAVPFLKKAYELLCLLVGDLIVGASHSRVHQKFLTWHADVRVKLESAGIALAEPAPWPENENRRVPGGCLFMGLFGGLLG